MQLIDPIHKFYRPLWIRLAVVAVCLGWAIVEAWSNEPFWAIIVGALGIYAAYMLLLTYSPPPLPTEPDPATVVNASDAADKDPE